MITSKTIEYGFETFVGAAAGATASSVTSSIYIPETTSRNFTNVTMIAYFYDTATTPASVTSWGLGCKLGSAATDVATTTYTLANTGEQQSSIFSRDLTSYFNTNFGSGGSQTCQVTLNIAALAFSHVAIKFYITYTFDDADNTRIKTVTIPIESLTGYPGTGLTSIYSNQIPAFSSILPENSIVYRNIWLELMCNDGGNAVTDFTNTLAIDGETGVASITQEKGSNSANYYIRHWSRLDLSTTASANVVHDLKMSTSLASRYLFPGALLKVTYEYNHSATTRVINSLQMPISEKNSFAGGSTNASSTTEIFKWFIEEPGTITLRQSGLLITFVGAAAISNLRVVASGQSEKAYTHAIGSAQAGQWSLIHRIDSGAAAGTGISLARGLNQFHLNIYRSSTNADTFGSNFGKMLYLNYESDLYTGPLSGEAHNKTLIFGIVSSVAGAQIIDSKQITPSFFSSCYYLNNIGTNCYLNGSLGANSIILQGKRTPSDTYPSGFVALGEALIKGSGTAELNLYQTIFDCTKKFKRHRYDPVSSIDVLDLSTPRFYRLENSNAQVPIVLLHATVHSISSLVSGALVNYTGVGSGVIVDVYRDDTKENILKLTTGTGGVFSGTWFDDTIQLYCTAQQDSTHYGRSGTGYAVTG